MWEEALRAHYLGQGKKWGREEFDKLLGDYDATCDVPCCMLVDELLAAYPDVKVILTERNVDSWLGSMRKTFWQVRSWKSWDIVAPWHPVSPPCPSSSFSINPLPSPSLSLQKDHKRTKESSH